MDAKSLRAAMKDKAKRLAGSSSAKVDSSDFTPAEPLDANVKTGLRPLSRRAFKAGGKVEGADNAPRGDRTPRGSVGLANTNQRIANEERDGKKHVGGFKRGGRADGGKTIDVTGEADGMPQDDGKMLMKKKLPSGTVKGEPKVIDVTGEADGMPEDDGYKRGGKAKKARGGLAGGSNNQPITTAGPDSGGREAKKNGGKAKKNMGGFLAAPDGSNARPVDRDWVNAQKRYEGDRTRRNNGGKAKKADGGLLAALSPAAMIAKDPKNAKYLSPIAMLAGKKKGGMVEGSAKDKAEDKVMAKKAGMSMKDWEKSAADKKHDAGCTCKACGGGVADRMARKDGGRTGKGKTNINIIISPHHDGKLGTLGDMPGQAPAMMPKPPAPPMPAPAPAAAAPMPMPHPGAVPPGLAQALAGAAGAGPMPGPGAGPMPGPVPPMMARKDGGKVYPKMKFGAGSGEGRLEKVEKYGKNAKA